MSKERIPFAAGIVGLVLLTLLLWSGALSADEAFRLVDDESTALSLPVQAHMAAGFHSDEAFRLDDLPPLPRLRFGGDPAFRLSLDIYVPGIRLAERALCDPCTLSASCSPFRWCWP